MKKKSSQVEICELGDCGIGILELSKAVEEWLRAVHDKSPELPADCRSAIQEQG